MSIFDIDKHIYDDSEITWEALKKLGFTMVTHKFARRLYHNHRIEIGPIPERGIWWIMVFDSWDSIYAIKDKDVKDIEGVKYILLETLKLDKEKDDEVYSRLP